MSKHDKDSPQSHNICYVDNFSKLFLVSMSEFCHQINFDGNELFVRPDTLSYLSVNWNWSLSFSLCFSEEIVAQK